MTNRIPLIVNAGAAQIQEITSTDVLQVPGNLTANVVQTDNYQYANGVPISFSGTYGNANVAAYLPTYTGNLTSVGYIQANTIAANANVVANNIISTTETVSGNLQAGNVSAVGNVVAGGVKTNNYMYANGDPFVSSNYGDSNVGTYLDGVFTGNIVPAGNNTQSLGNATNQWADIWVSNATIYLNSIPLGVSNIGVLQFDGNDLVTSGPNVINTGNVETTGNVVAGNLVIAAGGGLTFADGSVQTTAYGDANVEAYLPSSNTIIAINANAANTDGNVANLTTALGNTDSNVANLTTTVTNQGNDIANLQGAVYSNANVATFLDNFGSNSIFTTGNISAGDVTLTNLYSPNFYGNAVTYTNATGYVTSSNLFKYDPTTEVLTVGNVSTTGNITTGILTANILVGEGGNIANITGANVTGEVAVANTVSNPSQPNITALGTIVSLTANALTVNGTMTANGNAQFNADVYFAGNVTIPGNVTQISGNSGQFFGNAVTGFGALYAGLPAGYTLLNQEVMQYATSFDGYTQVSMQNINSGSQATGDFVITADNGNDTTNHIDLGMAGSGYNGLLANNSLGTSLYANDGYLYTRGNVNGGNLILGSNQANGVVRIIANGASNIGDVVATFSANGLAMLGDISTVGVASPAPVISGFSFNGANITGANIRTAGLISAAGNITVGNVLTGGTVSAAGNVTGDYIIGNGSLLTSLPAPTVAQDITSNGAMSIMLYDGNIKYNNYATVEPSTGNIAGANISATGNIRGANFTTAGAYLGEGNVYTESWLVANNMGVDAYQINVNQSITWPGTSAVFEDTNLVLQGNVGVSITSPGDTVITAGSNNWTFDNTGNLTIPGTSGGVIKTVANGAIAIAAMNNGTDNPAQLMSWRTTETNPDTIVSAYANSATVMTNVAGAMNTWTFDNSGNLTLPANTFAVNYANGTPVALGGDYSDSNVSTYLASGNNSAGYSTTGNVTANYLQTAAGASSNITGANYINANYFVGDGSLLTNVTVSTTYGNSNVVSLLAAFGSNVVSTTGNVTASYVVADGSQLTNLPTPAPVVGTVTSGATITPTGSSTQYNVTALAVAADFAAPSGSPVDGQKLTIRILDDGTAQALTWNVIYQVIGTTLPTTTVANKYTYVGLIYNGQSSKWDVVSVAQQA